MRMQTHVNVEKAVFAHTEVCVYAENLPCKQFIPVGFFKWMLQCVKVTDALGASVRVHPSTTVVRSAPYRLFLKIYNLRSI
jgi:hypothetical protein